jgi:predicted Zn-dependent protease
VSVTAANAPIAARAFGPGFAPDGTPVQCTVSALGLQLVGDHAATPVPGWAALQWRRGGFNGSQFFVSWSSDQGDYTLSLGDPAAEAALMAHLDAPRRAVSPGQRTTRTISAALIAFMVGVPAALLVALVFLAGPLIDWAIEKIPVDTEIRLGRQAFAQARHNLALVEDHPALPMLRELGRRLTAESAYPYEFHIARDPTVNAFAMPGGFIVFHTALLEKADSAEEVAGVLSHEIQHVERRHGLRGLVHSAGWRVGLSLVFGQSGGSMAAAWAENLGSLRFSRSQESEADTLGVRRLMAKGIDPRGMLGFFHKLETAGPNIPALLSSHPASADRFREIERQIPAGTRFPPLPYEYARLRRLP